MERGRGERTPDDYDDDNRDDDEDDEKEDENNVDQSRRKSRWGEGEELHR